MHRIIYKQIIAEDIKRVDILAPAIAARFLPGQFVMVTPSAHDDNIPMTIVDADPKKSVISLIVHEIGPSTQRLGAMSIGEGPWRILGPLGRGAQIDKYGLVVCVATGIGAAGILPICRALKKRGNKVIGIMGAKSKKVLMLESQMRVVCDEIFITTNDGSYERKALATDVLKELLNKYIVHRIYAIGSLDMMQAASTMAHEKAIAVRVTVYPPMVNGLGLCGSCRVKINEQYRLACVDGPEFDGYLVDYKDLSYRMDAWESSWKNQTPSVSRKKEEFTTFVKSLWGSLKK